MVATHKWRGNEDPPEFGPHMHGRTLKNIHHCEFRTLPYDAWCQPCYYRKMAEFTALNDDVLTHLIETLLGPDFMKGSDSPISPRMQKLRPARIDSILPLSSTCKRMRVMILPLLFREEKFWRTKMVHLPDDRKIWPRNIWAHIV